MHDGHSDGSAGTNERLHLLKTISDLLDTADSLAAVIDCVQLQYPEHLGVDRASVLVYDASQGVLVSGHFIGAVRRSEDGSCLQELNSSISGSCFIESRPILVNDCSVPSVIPNEQIDRLSLKSCVAIPILLEGTPMGVLRLDDTHRANRFSEQDIDLYQLVAQRISIAIRHFQLSVDRTLAEEALHLACNELEQRVEERTAELARANEALNRELAERRRAELLTEVLACLGHRLSIAATPREAAEATLNAVDELYGWDACFATILGEDERVQVLYRMDEIDGQRQEYDASPADLVGPLTRKVMEEGAHLILRYDTDPINPCGKPFGNTSRRSASLMFVPVRRQGRNIGVLSIQSYTPDAYTPKDLDVFGSLAIFCSGALERTAAAENLRISQEALRQETAYVQLLGDVATAANLASSVDEALQTVVERICEVTQWPLGHALIRTGSGVVPEFVSAGIWHLQSPEKYARFRAGSEAMVFKPGVSLPGYVLQTGRPEFVLNDSPQPWMRRTALLNQVGFRSGFAFPVLVGSEIVAILEFFSEQIDGPTQRLLEVVKHVGVQLGRVVERKRAETRVSQGAQYDALTGLPNRVFFLDSLERSVARARRHSAERFAVLYLDLDRFKMINDSLGHDTGDRLLVVVAQRLSECLREEDVVARLGGDEFAVLLENVQSPSDAVYAANRIQAALGRPVILGTCESYSGASIGIVLNRPGGEDTPGDLLRDADVAMYRAKQAGRGCYAVFDEGMHEQVFRQLRMESEMRRGLERGDFIVHYQPIVSLPAGRVAGFEALVRWRHPEYGLLSPSEFIPLAEETGLIVPLGWEVLHQACLWMRRRLAAAPLDYDLSVSVNITARQMREPDFLQRIERALKAAKLPARHLHLEVTEGTVMDNVEQTVEILTQLREMEVRVLVDDFGTGYSSLSYLARFPIDALKIDHSFVQGLAAQGNSEVVQAILALACGLRLEVVAEGVETVAQLAELRGLGCELTQGFLFSRPMDAEAALELPLTLPELSCG